MTISALSASNFGIIWLDNFINATFKNGLWSFLIVSVLIILVVMIVWRILESAMEKHHIGIFVRHIVKTILYALGLLGILLQIVPLQQYAVSLLAGSSVVAVVLGFAAQDAMANVVGGFFIAGFKPYTEGQLIKVPSQGITGTVEDITIRHTVIKTIDNARVIIPNSIMNSATIENLHYADMRSCNFLDIGVGYGADIELAKKIIVEEATAHPSCIDIRSDEEKAAGAPIVNIRCTALGASSVDLRAIIWSKDFGSGAAMLSDLRQSVKKRFDAEGVEIPFAYTNVILKKD